MAEKTIQWADAPTQDDLADARRFLTLLGIGSPTDAYPAKDLLRAAGLSALPQDNKGVAKWRQRIEDGNVVPPVLLLQGSLVIDRPLIIAEGYHRVSACYLRNEQTTVFVHFLRVDA